MMKIAPILLCAALAGLPACTAFKSNIHSTPPAPVQPVVIDQSDYTPPSREEVVTKAPEPDGWEYIHSALRMTSAGRYSRAAKLFETGAGMLTGEDRRNARFAAANAYIHINRMDKALPLLDAVDADLDEMTRSTLTKQDEVLLAIHDAARGRRYDYAEHDKALRPLFNHNNR